MSRTDLDEEGHRIHAEITAILDEHLPPETVKVLLQKIDELSSNHFAIEDRNQLLIYRALMGFLPGCAQEIRAAFQPVTFNGSRSDEEDWMRWERKIEWPLTVTHHDDLMGKRDGGLRAV
jgi:hypothetical protein